MALIKSAFGEGHLSEESTWQGVVLTHKVGGDYRGIGPGLVEVMWKLVAVILNHQFKASITSHNIFHGFRAGRGTGTATLEAKLLLQLASTREDVLYVIFMDLQKAYGALDREICLYILKGMRSGTSGPLHPPGVLVQTADGSSRRGVLQGSI